MPEFRTIVDIEESRRKIGYEDNILFIGSCFAENIGNKLQENKFNTLINPFGIIYNPVSVANTILSILDKKKFTEEDLIFNNLWHSFYHHSKFSNEGKEDCLKNINISCIESSDFLKKTDFLVITFGTSWVYEYIKTGKIVSNCHKLPSKNFNRYRLSIDYIVELYIQLIEKIREQNPNIKIIFTVSPVRHWKDGAHGNQLSKAVLQLAIDKLVQSFKNIWYFPSYEIVMDELRDYRFYDRDMIHISEEAVDYIWQRFIETFIDNKSQSLMGQVEKIKKALAHRPFSSESKTYHDFLENQMNKIMQIENNNPYIDFNKEKSFIKEKIKK